MGTKTIKGKFLPQYRTAAQWSAADTVLLRGEIGVESDTRKFKFGDGTTSWNNLGYAQGESAGGSSEIIYISDAESISKAVISVEWNELGQIRPIIIFDPAGVAGLPADVPSNCTLIGNVQKVDDGTISSDDGYVVNLNVFQEDNFLSGIWYQILLNSAGEVLEEKKYSLDNKGRLRDVKLLTTSFWNLISPNDTDIQAFVVDYNSPEVPAKYQGEGFGFARHFMDDVGMATVTIKLTTGWVKTFNVTFYEDGSDPYWEELGGSSSSSGGMEKISDWTDLRYAIVNTDEGQGEMVVLPLTRELKSTDIVLVTWRKENASYTNSDIAGQAIFHPGAYSHDVGLEVVEDYQDAMSNYGLYLDQSSSEIGSASLSVYAMSSGVNSYGPQYLITGIYNISGK